MSCAKIYGSRNGKRACRLPVGDGRLRMETEGLRAARLICGRRVDGHPVVTGR